jgi:hypothetical protein
VFEAQDAADAEAPRPRGRRDELRDAGRASSSWLRGALSRARLLRGGRGGRLRDPAAAERPARGSRPTAARRRLAAGGQSVLVPRRRSRRTSSRASGRLARARVPRNEGAAQTWLKLPLRPGFLPRRQPVTLDLVRTTGCSVRVLRTICTSWPTEHRSDRAGTSPQIGGADLLRPHQHGADALARAGADRRRRALRLVLPAPLLPPLSAEHVLRDVGVRTVREPPPGRARPPLDHGRARLQPRAHHQSHLHRRDGGRHLDAAARGPDVRHAAFPLPRVSCRAVAASGRPLARLRGPRTASTARQPAAGRLRLRSLLRGGRAGLASVQIDAEGGCPGGSGPPRSPRPGPSSWWPRARRTCTTAGPSASRSAS